MSLSNAVYTVLRILVESGVAFLSLFLLSFHVSFGCWKVGFLFSLFFFFSFRVSLVVVIFVVSPQEGGRRWGRSPLLRLITDLVLNAIASFLEVFVYEGGSGGGVVDVGGCCGSRVLMGFETFRLCWCCVGVGECE